MNAINLWQVASVPFWLLGFYFVAQAAVELRVTVPTNPGVKPRPRCVPCNLIAAGVFAVIAAKIAL